MSTFGPRTQRFVAFMEPRGVQVHRREEAGLIPPLREDPLPSFDEMIDHHTVTAQEPIIPILQGVQSYHFGRGWSDAAYSAGIRNLDGSVWLLRGMDNQSGGTGHPMDTYSLCFVAVGNFEEEEPSQAMLDTYGHIRAWAISEGADRNKADRDYNLTQCCGSNLYVHVPHVPLNAPSPTPTPPVEPWPNPAGILVAAGII